MPGPVPKPKAERRRRPSKAEGVQTPDVVPAGGVAVARPPDATWHPIAQEWWTSLAQSGQSRLYEPSDWAEARACAELMSRLFAAERPSAQLAQTVMAWTTNLLTSEGSRRRLRLELSRGPQADPDEEASVAALDDYRRMVGG